MQAAFRAQAEIETILVFAVVVVLVVAVAVTLPNQAMSSENVRQRIVAQNTVDTLAAAADEVYLAGEGGKRYVWIDVPPSYESATSFIGNSNVSASWANKKTVNIRLSPGGDVMAVTRAPICGSWPSSEGRYRVAVSYNSTSPVHVTINGYC